MIDFSLPLPVIMRKLLAKRKMNGHEKVTALIASLSGGHIGPEHTHNDISDAWRVSIMKQKYYRTFITRAEAEGWITVSKSKHIELTSDGMDFLNSIIDNDEASTGGVQGLTIFTAGQTHTYDKQVRSFINSAKSDLRVVDSYVDERIFDNLLDSVDHAVRVRLLYGKSQGSFDARATRFSREFTRFNMKKASNIHDRFMIVDSVGYILGASLKDAADRSATTIVRLSAKDTEKLIKFFDEFWKKV